MLKVQEEAQLKTGSLTQDLTTGFHSQDKVHILKDSKEQRRLSVQSCLSTIVLTMVGQRELYSKDLTEKGARVL